MGLNSRPRPAPDDATNDEENVIALWSLGALVKLWGDGKTEREAERPKGRSMGESR